MFASATRFEFCVLYASQRPQSLVKLVSHHVMSAIENGGLVCSLIEIDLVKKVAVTVRWRKHNFVGEDNKELQVLSWKLRSSLLIHTSNVEVR